MTEPMSPERLEQIETRLRTLQKQASGPEWPLVEDQWEAVEDETHGQGWGLVYGESSISPIASTYCMGVAELIAESHKVLPELLAETKRAWEQEAFLRRALGELAQLTNIKFDEDGWIVGADPDLDFHDPSETPALAEYLRSLAPTKEPQ